MNFFKKSTLISIFFCLFSNESVPAQCLWATQTGGNSLKEGIDVDTDGGGNSYTIGNYSAGVAIFGSTSLQNFGTSLACFLSKTDASGNFLWAVRMGGGLAVYGESVVTNGTDIFITGKYRGNFTFYSTSSTTITLTGSNTNDDCYIAKYDINGVIQWAIQYGGNNHQIPYDIAISNTQQKLYVTGVNAGKIFVNCYNFLGVLDWSKQSVNSTPAEGRGIVADANGNCYVVARYTLGPISFPSTSTFSGSNNMLLLKIGLSGNIIWINNIGGAGSEVPTGGIGIDGVGDLYVSGEYTQTANISSIFLTNNSSNNTDTDLFVAKYNNAGIVQWAKSAGGVNHENTSRIATDISGNSFILATIQENNSVTINCQTFSSVLGNTDNKFFVLKYDNIGNVVWSTAPIVNRAENKAWGIATHGDGFAVIVGALSGNITFGTKSITNVPSTFVSDMYIAKLKKEPLNSDFSLTAVFPTGGGGLYQLSAIPAVIIPKFWWEVSEIDAVGNVITGTTMTNPSNWWSSPFIANNVFPGYCCNQTTTTGNGIFTLGRKYKITRGVWSDCDPWISTTKIVYMSF